MPGGGCPAGLRSCLACLLDQDLVVLGAGAQAPEFIFQDARRSMLLLALCGLAFLASARAMAMAPAPAPMAGQPLTADVLLPETDSDMVSLLSHLMSAQHEVVLATHGKVRCCWMLVALRHRILWQDLSVCLAQRRTRPRRLCPSRPPLHRSSSQTGTCSSRTTRPCSSTWRTTLCRTSRPPPTRCASNNFRANGLYSNLPASD